MSIYDRLRLLALCAPLLAGAAVGCAEPGSCFRFSDCSAGLACVSGRCVSSSGSGPTDGASGDADDSGAASNDSGVVPIDSPQTEAAGTDATGTDAGPFEGGDAPTD